MELFQTMATALTTPNQELINTTFILFSFIEVTIYMLFFTTILNINANKKQKIIFIILTSTVSIISNYKLPQEFAPIINLVLNILLIKFCFKVSILKSLFAQIFILIVMSTIEPIIVKIVGIGFHVTYTDMLTIPLYRFLIILLEYGTFFMLYIVVKKCNINIKLLDNMTKANKTVFIVTFIFGVSAIISQLFVFKSYTENLPFFISLISFLCLLVYFFLSLYSLTRTTTLEITQQNLEEAQLYNKSLKILHDNLRAFKHDFGNIVQAIGGYAMTNDTEGLRVYYSQLLEDCNKVNNLSTLNPDVINNPAVYSILASKYLKCDELGIKINLNVFLDLNTLNTKIYEFTRVLGILMDNAIEASVECKEKIINVEIRKDPSVNRQLLVVENTYLDKDIKIDEIFKKNYTSKPNHSGIGLWEVNQILNKNTNLALYTTKTDMFFKQQFEIY